PIPLDAPVTRATAPVSRTAPSPVLRTVSTVRVLAAGPLLRGVPNLPMFRQGACTGEHRAGERRAGERRAGTVLPRGGRRSGRPRRPDRHRRRVRQPRALDGAEPARLR